MTLHKFFAFLDPFSPCHCPNHANYQYCCHVLHNPLFPSHAWRHLCPYLVLKYSSTVGSLMNGVMYIRHCLIGSMKIKGIPLCTYRLFSVQNHSLSNLIHHEWMKHQLNNWFLLIPKPKLDCVTCHCYHQEYHLVGWIKRNQKDSIRIIFLSDFWVLMAFIHFFDSGIKRNQIFEWAVFTQLKTAYPPL